MQWLWIILGLALAAAPLVYIVPRPAQRRQALLRERCRQLGLEVRLNALPQNRRLRVRREPPLQGVRILRRAKRKALAATDQWLLVRDESDEEIPSAARAYIDLLAAQPAMVVALEHAADGTAAWCDERGTPEDIDVIAAALDDLLSTCGREHAQ